MAAAFPFTVSTTGRLLFLSCFMKSPERRRKVVSDWMSLVMSSIGLLLLKHLFRCEQNIPSPPIAKVLFSVASHEHQGIVKRHPRARAAIGSSGRRSQKLLNWRSPVGFV